MRPAQLQGGEETLEREKKVTEENEPLNVREPDALDAAIADLTGHETSGHIVNQTFEISHEFSRPTYETFDRFYPALKLLVHYFAGQYPHVAAKEEAEADVARKAAYAKEHGYTFLPIFDGQVTEVDLAKALGALK